jgi:hypothetical protein
MFLMLIFVTIGSGDVNYVQYFLHFYILQPKHSIVLVEDVNKEFLCI